MTPQEILTAYNQWKIAHIAIHGSLSVSEVRLANEIADFLVNCAQVYEPVYPNGYPFSQDLDVAV